MSAGEKNEFQILADKENLKRKLVKPPEQIINQRNNSVDFWMQKEYVKNMFELITDNNGKINLIC